MPANIYLPFTPSYGTALDKTPDVRRLDMGDGYVQRSGRGLNFNRHKYSVKFDVRTDSEADDMMGFFDSLGGTTPFLWDFPGNSIYDTMDGVGVGDGSRTQFQPSRSRRPQVAKASWQGKTSTYTTPRTNLITGSQDSSSSNLNTCAVTANAGMAPDGTRTAVRLRNSSGTNPYWAKSFTIPATGQEGAPYTFSVYLRAESSTTSSITVYDNAISTAQRVITARIEEGPGTITNTTTGANVSGLSPTRWTRVSITVPNYLYPGTTYKALVYAHTAGAAADTNSLLVWQWQMEPGPEATTPIPTTGAPVTTAPKYWPQTDEGFEPIYYFSTSPDLTLLAPYVYDPFEGARLPYTYCRSNLILSSDDGASSNWVKTRASITSDFTYPPDLRGTAYTGLSADVLVEDSTASNTHYLSQTILASSLPSSSTAIFSMYVKQNGSRHALLQAVRKDATNAQATFNLTTGAVTGASNVLGSGCVQVTTGPLTGWWRIWIAFSTMSGGTTPTCTLYMTDNSLNSTYSGNGTSGLYFARVQLETPYDQTQTTPTSPIYTDSSQVTLYPEFIENPSFYVKDWQGLNAALPWARQNLCTQGRNVGGTGWSTSVGGTGGAPTVTLNYAQGPDGVSGSAARIQASQGAGATTADYSMVVSPAYTSVTGTLYVHSVWLKSNTGSNQTVYLAHSGAGAVAVTVTPTWRRYWCPWTATSSGSIQPHIGARGTYTAGGTSLDILACFEQVEVPALFPNGQPTVPSPWVDSMLTSGVNLSITAPNTVTRASGNFTNEGYYVGQKVVLAGFTNGANNGTFTLLTVGTTTMTFVEQSFVTESAAAGRTITSLTTQTDYSLSSTYSANFSVAPKAGAVVYYTGIGAYTRQFVCRSHKRDYQTYGSNGIVCEFEEDYG